MQPIVDTLKIFLCYRFFYCVIVYCFAIGPKVRQGITFSFFTVKSGTNIRFLKMIFGPKSVL